MGKKNLNYKYLNKSNNMIVIDFYKCKKCKCLKLVDEFSVNEYNNKYLNKNCKKCRNENENEDEDEDDFIII